MATSISAVEASQPARLVDAAAEVGAMASRLESLIDTQRGTLAELRNGWTGEAADAAIARGEQNLAVQETLRGKLQTLHDVLSSGGGQLNSARTALLDMVSGLRSQGWEISDDGVATPPPNLSEAFRSVPQAYTLMMQKLLTTYAVIDDETAGRFPVFEPGG
ncbi:WXG100 family type VII secretion target [Mycobacterium sp. NPDC051804]|uniref:WXG100 family type VII secretion target n=1 Tax=Mycobacterium sp. NPDC051804 TaxID=3364295 RepID=UPI0037997799